jgi:hypothetical protein
MNRPARPAMPDILAQAGKGRVPAIGYMSALINNKAGETGAKWRGRVRIGARSPLFRRAGDAWRAGV